MPFDKETASEAGKKSKRGQSKITIAVKNKILDYLNDEGIDDAIKEIKKLEGLYKVKAIIDIAQYAIPKQKAVEHKGDNAIGTITVNFDSSNTMPPITSENDLFDDD